MKKYFLFVFLIFTFANIYAQDDVPANIEQSEFLLATTGSLKFGLYGFENPAILSYVNNFDIQFNWLDNYNSPEDFNKWGIFSASRNFGFGIIKESFAEKSVANYKVSLAAGNRNFSTGISYGWVSGEKYLFNYSNNFTLGILSRPANFISIGITGNFATDKNYRRANIEAAFRPFSNEILTLFADYNFRNKSYQNYGKQNWSAGIALELIPGIRFTGRYFKNNFFTAGAQLSLGNIGFSSSAGFDKNSDHQFNTYGIRIGAYDRNPIALLFPKKKFIEINLKGELKYQSYKWFDKSNNLIDILNQIEKAKNDKSVKGISINTSGMEINSEMLWELRDKLTEFKRSDKKVYIFVDRPDMNYYYFASVADKIVMDPLGMIMLQGFVSGRTFYKGALEKLGIAFEEWRFLKFKSAIENLSQPEMSEGDKEQRQRFIDVYFAQVKEGITRSRKISPLEFDSLVNNQAIFLADDALKFDLVDTLARWNSMKDIIKKFEDDDLKFTGKRRIEEYKLPDDNFWGEPDKIAVVYALGVCDLDAGISARSLSETIRSIKDDDNFKALILRVDSPGGDALASDYVAEAIKECKKVKPVIVSQGAVAASGGYWISMDADTIIAAPNTITGSIGVIGGWAYNNGFKEKIGFSTDQIQKGKHADLGFGMSLPLIGISLPDRNLTQEEFTRMKYSILSMYNMFVRKVSEGRNLNINHVENIAQGRIWIGSDALENKLIDLLGGLHTAIEIAKLKSGIKNDEKIKIVEFPEPPLFNLNLFKPSLTGIKSKEENKIEDLKFRFEHLGEPLIILPFEEYEMIFQK